MISVIIDISQRCLKRSKSKSYFTIRATTLINFRTIASESDVNC